MATLEESPTQVILPTALHDRCQQSTLTGVPSPEEPNLEAEEGRWPDPDHGPFRLRVWFGRVDDRPAVVGVELWGVEPQQRDWLESEAGDEAIDVVTGKAVSRDWLGYQLPDAAVRAEDVRLPLGRLLDDWLDRQRAFARASRLLWGDSPGHEARVQRFERRLEGKRTGPPRLTDDFLQQVTDIYNGAARDGARNPAAPVQAALGARTPSTARSWIREARRRGFPVVPPPTRKGNQ